MTNSSAAKAGDAVISIRGVSMSYSGRRVLDRVDLDVCRGEILVLLGGSGSGKTTLLKHVLGLRTSRQRRSTADILAARRSNRRGSPTYRCCFQAGALFNSMTVEDNVVLPLRG